LDIVDVGDFIFSVAERLFDTADGIEEIASEGSVSLSIDIANLSPELEELRKSGCDALSEIMALVDLPLYELEAAFEDTDISSYAKAVLEIKKDTWIRPL